MTAPTPLQIVILLVTLVLGFCSQAAQTGSLFGVKTLPRPWLPYVTLAVGVLSGLLGELQKDLAAGASLTLAVFGMAMVQSLISLTATMTGSAAATHLVAHRMTLQGPPAGSDSGCKGRCGCKKACA